MPSEPAQTWQDRPGERPRSFVFIVTYGRSGSTLLQNLLNALPAYQIRGENNNAALPLAMAWHAVEASQPMAGMRRSGIPSGAEHPFYGAEQVDPSVFGQALADSFVDTVLKPDTGIRVTGFKEIRFHERPQLFGTYMTFLRRFFPGCRFVFNTRDLDAVLRSGWWARMSPDKAQQQLANAERLFAGYIARNPRICCHMHYDEYVGDPAKLAPLFDFLGEQLAPEAIARIFDTRLDHARAPKSGR